MILSLLLIFSLGCTLGVYFLTNLYQSLADLWILLVTFICGFIVGVIILLIYIYILSLFVNKKKENNKAKKIYVRTVQRVSELLLMLLGARVHIRGMENIPTDQKFLFVSNHQSWVDAIVTAWTLRAYRMSFVLKKSLMTKFVLGEYLHACGFISLDRENAREGVKSINKCVDKIISNEASVLIFPEGTRSGGYEMGEFHSGSFKIATKAKCPIVVCSLQNSFKVTKRFPFRHTNVYVDIIEVLNYSDYQDKTTQELSDYTHNLIKENLENLPKY